MGTKSTTTVTFAVKMQVPKGSNVHEIQMYIRNAIICEGGNYEKEHPLFSIPEDSFTVSLLKKETVYGKS